MSESPRPDPLRPLHEMIHTGLTAIIGDIAAGSTIQLQAYLELTARPGIHLSPD